MTGYVRVDTSNNIADGNVISAADLDNEFDGIQAAFNASTGHNHDGTTGEGAPILVLGPTQDVVVGASTVTPKTTNTVDIGSSSLKFKDLFLAGNTSIGGTLGVTGVATLGNGAVLGTPASVTLTNATGLPIATGVSGLGTGVATALAVNVGSAGAPVLFNGALGTPASGTVTNLTGTASININGTVGATTANTGAFTTLSASSTVTLSGGTANGVAYLNASKELTSGSALTFDGTNLGVVNSAPTITVFETASGNNNRLIISQSGITTSYNSTYSSGDAAQAWKIANTEGMRLTSTGLGIGTSSVTAGFKLDVNGNARIGNGSAQGFEIQPGALTFIGAYNRATSVYTPLDVAGEYLRFSTNNGAEKMRLDTSGNLGLGVTPSAWGSNYKSIEVSNGGGNIFGIAGIGTTGIGFNFYNNNTNDIYKFSTYAAKFQVNNAGQFVWYTAPSGTAGDAISFTQALSLTAVGNLLLGGTTDPGGTKVLYIGNGTTPGTPTAGGVLYVESGALKYKGSSGTVTTLGAA